MTSANLRIHQLPLGQMDNYVYIVADAASGKAVVIDPGFEAGAILAAAGKHNYELTAIWLTHGHGDHTAAVGDILAQRPVPLILPRQMPDKWRPTAAQITEIDDGDTLRVGDIPFQVIYTPGHSPDGTCFLHGNHLLAGDTLFIDGCGRCDLPDSDVNAMYESIHGRLMNLPDETIIYPGHNYGPKPSDTLENQKRTNRFMVAASKEAFVRERMG